MLRLRARRWTAKVLSSLTVKAESAIGYDDGRTVPFDPLLLIAVA